MFLYFRLRIIYLLVLGFSSGLPLALTASILSTILFENNIDKSIIGLVGITSTFYALNFLWSPILDNIKIPLMSRMIGKRKSWLILSQIGLVISIIMTGLYSPSNNLTAFILGTSAIAFFSATQDLMVDTLRIEVLRDYPEEQGAGAASYMFGYRVAMLVSSAGSLYISSFYNWSCAYLVMGLLILPVIVFTLFFKFNDTGAYVKKISLAIFTQPFKNFAQHKKWPLILLVVVLYKMSDAYIARMTSPFLLDIGFSKIELANIVKVCGTGASFIGSFLAGYMISRTKDFYCILVFSIAIQCISNLAFIYQAIVGHDVYVLMGVISFENIAGGFSNTVFIVYLSKLCSKRFTTTQYALLSSCANFTRTFLASSSGYAVEYFGWVWFFIFSASISLPAIIVLKLIFNKK